MLCPWLPNQTTWIIIPESATCSILYCDAKHNTTNQFIYNDLKSRGSYFGVLVSSIKVMEPSKVFSCHILTGRQQEKERKVQRERQEKDGEGVQGDPDYLTHSYVRHFNEDDNSSLRKVVFKIFMYVEGREDSSTT